MQTNREGRMGFQTNTEKAILSGHEQRQKNECLMEGVCWLCGELYSEHLQLYLKAEAWLAE